MAAALTVRNAHTDGYDLETYQCLKQTLQEDLQRLFGPLLRFVMMETTGEVRIELSHQTVKDYFLESTDSEISSASARIAIHTEMAKACIPWDQIVMSCKFDHMFDAVQKHFGKPTTNWTQENILGATSLVAEQIVSKKASDLPNLPRILRACLFDSYADEYCNDHLAAALLGIISDVAPSLKARDSYGFLDISIWPSLLYRFREVRMEENT